MATRATPAHDRDGTATTRRACSDQDGTAALQGLYQATRAVPGRLRYTPTVRRARQIIGEHERPRDMTS